MRLRKWLQILREKKQLSQQNVADFLSVTRQYYNLIENGERQKDLDLSLVVKLSEFLGVSIEWIAEQEQKLK